MLISFLEYSPLGHNHNIITANVHRMNILIVVNCQTAMIIFEAECLGMSMLPLC